MTMWVKPITKIQPVACDHYVLFYTQSVKGKRGIIPMWPILNDRKLNKI